MKKKRIYSDLTFDMKIMFLSFLFLNVCKYLLAFVYNVNQNLTLFISLNVTLIWLFHGYLNIILVAQTYT